MPRTWDARPPALLVKGGRLFTEFAVYFWFSKLLTRLNATPSLLAAAFASV